MKSISNNVIIDMLLLRPLFMVIFSGLKVIRFLSEFLLFKNKPVPTIYPTKLLPVIEGFIL